MAKRFHSISINEGNSKNATRYDFIYSKRNVSMWLGKNKIFIEVEGGIAVKDNILNASSFYALLRRAHLAYALSFDGKLNVSSIAVNDERFDESYSNRGFPFVYSIIGKKLGLSDKWKTKEFIETLLNNRQLLMERNSKFAAVYSFIAANSSKIEIEQLSYLWICMNSYYRTLSQENNPDHDARDSTHIKFLLSNLNCGNILMSAKDRNKVATREKYRSLSNLLKFVQGDSELRRFYQACVRDTEGHNDSQYQELIRQIYDLGITPIRVFGILLLEFPYYLRCNYFHGNTPTALLARANGRELSALHVVNFFLKEFLNDRVPEMFGTAAQEQ